MKQNKLEEATEEISNFEKIDMDILMKQNQSLAHEIQKMKNLAGQESLSEQEKSKMPYQRFNKSLINLAEHLKKYFHEKSFGSNTDSKVKDLTLFLWNFFTLLEDICLKRRCFSQEEIQKWFELNKLPLEIFFSKIKQSSSGIDQKNSVFSSLEKKFENFQEQYLSSTKQNQNDLEESLKTFKIQLEDLAWENSILQKRLIFLTEYQKLNIDEIIDVQKNKEKLFCYCGGQLFKDTLTKLQIENIKTSLQQQFSIQNQNIQNKPQTSNFQDNQKYELQIKTLQKELQEMIQLVEQRKLDKSCLSEMILSSNFFTQIQQDFQSQLDYTQQICNKYERNLQQTIELEQLRKKELLFYRKQEDIEKQKLQTKIKSFKEEITKLNTKINYQKSQIQQLEKIKVNPIQKNNQDDIVKSLNNQIQNLITNYFEKTEKQNKELLRKNDHLKQNIFSLEKEKLIDKRILNREFRHKTHKKLFEELRKLTKDKKEINTTMDDFEKYLKTREKKIKILEKSLEDTKKYLKEEKQNNNSLIEEIVNGSKAFEAQLQNSSQLSQELQNISNNFNDVFNEKSQNEKQLNQKIEQLENEIQKKIQENKKLTTEIENQRFQIAQLDKNLKNQKYKYTDLDQTIKKIREDFSKIDNENQHYHSKVELLQNKLNTMKESNKTLTQEISQNIARISEKESIIRALLQNDLKDSDANTSGDLTLDQKRLFLINQMEPAIQKKKKLSQQHVSTHFAKAVLIRISRNDLDNAQSVWKKCQNMKSVKSTLIN